MEVVSILIPANNAAPWIAEAIESAIAQTWSNTEIIIIDDGSTDETLQIARRYASNKVNCITQENAGVCNARNKALSLAQGDFIQWLDADDFLAPDKVEQQIKIAHEVCDPYVLYSSAWASFFYRKTTAKLMTDSLWHDLAPVEFLSRKLKEITFMPSSAWLVSRELSNNAGPWDERLKRDNDGEYFCRVICLSRQIRFIRESLCYIRASNSNSISRNTSNEALSSIFLATSLSVNHFLKFSDTPETRSACLANLRYQFNLFHPERPDLVKNLQSLYFQLSGDYIYPEQTWKFRVMRLLFGWRISKKIRASVWNLIVFVRREMDKILYKLGLE